MGIPNEALNPYLAKHRDITQNVLFQGQWVITSIDIDGEAKRGCGAAFNSNRSYF